MLYQLNFNIIVNPSIYNQLISLLIENQPKNERRRVNCIFFRVNGVNRLGLCAAIVMCKNKQCNKVVVFWLY